MGGFGCWAVGVGHPWLLRLALDEAHCAGPALHDGHPLWHVGSRSSQEGPSAGLPVSSLSPPQPAAHQGELSPSPAALEPAFSPFTHESCHFKSCGLPSGFSALALYFASAFSVWQPEGSQVPHLLSTLLTSLSPQKEPGPWPVFQDPCWAR